MIHPNNCDHLNVFFEYDVDPYSMGDESDVYKKCADCGATLFEG